MNPRSGSVRVVERIRFALRATDLIELTMAGRIGLGGGRITVSDPTPVGVERLDEVLAWLHENRQNTALEVWLREGPPGLRMIRRYLTILADQGALRIRDRGWNSASRASSLTTPPRGSRSSTGIGAPKRWPASGRRRAARRGPTRATGLSPPSCARAAWTGTSTGGCSEGQPAGVWLVWRTTHRSPAPPGPRAPPSKPSTPGSQTGWAKPCPTASTG
ncbi:GPP34 family phosphoprotein [Catenulispora sp. NL8]|uniref:GPP34 family phosphoprotein n=1 Tax=Catenulispora pinistramenti TaxID=2705254 RepID=A0ABS5KXX7_9ACTN|nr:GPP34 family phosphoprotein [Catenulispora pinistramenti]